MNLFLSFFILITFQSSLGWTKEVRHDEIQKALQDFYKNPAVFMSKVPPKWDSRGHRVDGQLTKFTSEQIQKNDFISAKEQSRRKVRQVRVAGKKQGHVLAPIGEGDDPQDFFAPSYKLYRRLEDMEKSSLLKGTVKTTPWSGHYWPYYTGILGYRYADQDMPRSENWLKNFNYFAKVTLPLGQLTAATDESVVLKLSPAEKYDALVGDESQTLAQFNWNAGKTYYDEYKKVETWMGICHGWAPAAYVVNDPRKSVEVLAADGATKLIFYPHDIKALASALWANAETQSLSLGGRCDSKSPKKDTNGRVVDQSCFDDNPGTWHMVVVNRLGRQKKSFVIDASFDYEVWNQPVSSYQYTYFNPETLEETSDLNKARIEIADFKKDKFKKYRSKDAKYVVGVAMDLSYVTESEPSTDEDEESSITKVRYMYDLELSADFKIIGGEWYSQLHPDFLWTPPDEAQAYSIGDSGLRGEWSGKDVMPASWRKGAVTGSRYGQPLAKIIETLVEKSHK